MEITVVSLALSWTREWADRLGGWRRGYVIVDPLLSPKDLVRWFKAGPERGP